MGIWINSSLCHTLVYHYGIETESVVFFFKCAIFFCDALYAFGSKSDMPGRISLLTAVDSLPQCDQFLRYTISKEYSIFSVNIPQFCAYACGC